MLWHLQVSEPMKIINKIWRIWKYSIGSFSDEQTAEYDNPVAVTRSFIVLINVICACLIMLNIIKNW